MNRLSFILASLALSVGFFPTSVLAQNNIQVCLDDCLATCLEAAGSDTVEQAACASAEIEQQCEDECGQSPAEESPTTSVGAPAAGTPAPADVPRTLQNPLGTSDLRIVIGNIVRALLGFSGAAALLMFVWGGFQFLTAAGNPKRVEQGKQTLIWATIGLVVIFSAYTLLDTLVKALSGSVL